MVRGLEQIFDEPLSFRRVVRCGRTFSKHLRIERLFRDAHAGAIMAPTGDVLREFIWKSLLGMPLFLRSGRDANARLAWEVSFGRMPTRYRTASGGERDKEAMLATSSVQSNDADEE